MMAPENLIINEVEPNDARVTAKELVLQELISDSGYYTIFGAGEINPATANNYWSDPDYWYFQALAGDVISISMDSPNSDLDPYLELRDSSDSVLLSDNNSGPDNDALIEQYTIPYSSGKILLFNRF